jgi:hypothetical protein
MTDDNETPKELQPYIEDSKFIDNLLKKGHDDSASVDFEMARSNIHEMIEDGKQSMQKLAEIAASSQHPRAFEVYAKMMDSVLNANKELLNLQTKIREINHADSPVNEKAKNVTNNLFVGSTAELQKMIQEMKKDD